MATFTEVVAAVVVHSSAVAFSHFGVTVDVPQVERPAAASDRVVARSPRKPAKISNRMAEKLSDKVTDCPEQRAGVVKV